METEAIAATSGVEAPPPSTMRDANVRTVGRITTSGRPRLQDENLFRGRCFINGSWSGADDGLTFEVRNPATGEALGVVPSMGVAGTRCAIKVLWG